MKVSAMVSELTGWPVIKYSGVINGGSVIVLDGGRVKPQGMQIAACSQHESNY